MSQWVSRSRVRVVTSLRCWFMMVLVGFGNTSQFKREF